MTQKNYRTSYKFMKGKRIEQSKRIKIFLSVLVNETVKFSSKKTFS